MPMSRDEKDGGTNADGPRSTVYGRHRYAEGEFTRKVPQLARWTS